MLIASERDTHDKRINESRVRQGGIMRVTHVLSLGLAATTALVQPSIAETRTAIFAGGCFWCVESDFESVKGVKDAVSGFTGGTTKSPTYRSHGDHIEAVKITFDDAIVSYDELVGKFFRSIDPTDDGGQFCDRGHAYTTAVFGLNDAQLASANAAKAAAADELGKPVVTDVRAASTFYPVGEYHQGYYKSTDLVITRFGPKSKKDAYKLYRDSCGRDASVQALWGDQAPFIN